MKRLLCIGYGVLALGLAANAQTWGQDPRYTPRNDPYYRNGRNQQSPINRVMIDLNRAADRARLDGHEAKHFDEVARNLREFEDRWARGKFDTGKLDRAINSLQHLAEADRVRGRDRDMLDRDLQDLRQFRASRGRYFQDPSYYPNWR